MALERHLLRAVSCSRSNVPSSVPLIGNGTQGLSKDWAATPSYVAKHLPIPAESHSELEAVLRISRRIRTPLDVLNASVSEPQNSPAHPAQAAHILFFPKI